MPYIKKQRRDELDQEELEDIKPATVGELNYVITTICVNYLKLNSTSYRVINEIMGAIECAKQEFYRRVAVPYEQIKIKENGDISGYVVVKECPLAPPAPPPIRRVREGYTPMKDQIREKGNSNV